MPNFRLTLEYDGAGFAGWQVQAGGVRSLQGELEAAIERVTGVRTRVHGAGRTDAGVHAEGQVANLTLETTLAAPALQRALNALLPPDLAVVKAEIAPDAFHARYHALGKLYRYRIWNAARPSPLRAARVWWVKPALDVAAMASAGALLLGTHDFASFQAVGSDVASTLRTLTRCDVLAVPEPQVPEPNARGEIEIRVEGSGFLRHMVRILAGTLVQVGMGRREPGSLPAVLAARDRRAAGPTAPPQGLTLVRVAYSDSA
ncbi:MAG TPA: tRNA pseudouridine(38-40) synthase TruA [Myxococcota bacterium]